ncbi:MAG: hypothetical protein WC340_11885 [Kiritimatiellia bacterium]
MKISYRISVLGILAVMLLAINAQAVTVINKTTGETLFFDDFETALGVSHAAFPDTSGDYDPTKPAVGTWTISESPNTTVQVTDYHGDAAHPAATPQGTNYLRVVRNRNGATTIAKWADIQNTTGDVIHVEAMIWIPGDADSSSFQLILSGSLGELRANVTMVQAGTGSDYGVVNASKLASPKPVWVNSTLRWLANTWQKWEIDYAVWGETFDLTIDGVKKTLPLSGLAGDVEICTLKGGAPQDNGRFYVDSTGYDGSRQNKFMLFKDSFENATNGAVPYATMPDIGTYQSVWGATKVCTGDLSVVGGPTAAYSGSNYVELSRLTGGLDLGCAFAGGAINPNTQEIHTRFRLWWGGAGLPGHGLRTSTPTWDSTNCLTYNMIWSDASYREYDDATSSYVPIPTAGSFPKNAWVPIELVWSPRRQEAKVSINGGPLLPNRLWGSVPAELYQLHFASGNSSTVYWVDDIESYWLYTPPPPSGTVILL